MNRYHAGGGLAALAALLFVAMGVWLWLTPATRGQDEWGPVEILFLGPGIVLSVVSAGSMAAVSFSLFREARRGRSFLK